MRSMDLFFHLRIRLTVSSLSEGKGRKIDLPQVLLGNSMEDIWMRNIAIKIGGYVWKIVIKYFGYGWGVTDRRAIVVWD